MSFSIYLEINTGNEYHYVAEPIDGCTHNLHPIFGACGIEMRNLHEKMAHDVIELTHRAYALSMNPENHEALKALEPPNRWGDLAGAQECLARLAAACATHPKCRLRYSG